MSFGIFPKNKAPLRKRFRLRLITLDEEYLCNDVDLAEKLSEDSYTFM